MENVFKFLTVRPPLKQLAENGQHITVLETEDSISSKLAKATSTSSKKEIGIEFLKCRAYYIHSQEATELVQKVQKWRTAFNATDPKDSILMDGFKAIFENLPLNEIKPIIYSSYVAGIFQNENDGSVLEELADALRAMEVWGNDGVSMWTTENIMVEVEKAFSKHILLPDQLLKPSSSPEKWVDPKAPHQQKISLSKK